MINHADVETATRTQNPHGHSSFHRLKPGHEPNEASVEVQLHQEMMRFVAVRRVLPGEEPLGESLAS